MDPNMQAQQGGAPQGGGAPAPGGAPQGGGDPAAQIQPMLQQYAQSRDPQLATQICDLIVESSGMGGGAGGGDPNAQGAPAGGSPGGGAPGMMRKGGKMAPKFTSTKGKELKNAKESTAKKRPSLMLPGKGK